MIRGNVTPTRSRITKLRNTQKTLATIHETIKELYFRLEPRTWDVPHEFEEILEKLNLCTDKLLKREHYLVWALHPKTRKRDYTVSRWALPNLSEYTLQTLRTKAPDQWLIETLNSELVSLFSGAASVSEMTRYKIISALLKTGAEQTIDYGTIKQHFVSRKNLSAKACKNS